MISINWNFLNFHQNQNHTLSAISADWHMKSDGSPNLKYHNNNKSTNTNTNKIIVFLSMPRIVFNDTKSHTRAHANLREAPFRMLSPTFWHFLFDVIALCVIIFIIIFILLLLSLSSLSLPPPMRLLEKFTSSFFVLSWSHRPVQDLLLILIVCHRPEE